jgi:large subunit ribosomal protein L17
MRKMVFGNQLSRDKNERKALFRSLVSNFILNNELATTKTKAKAVQSQIEKLITKGKNGTIADRRIAQKFLTKKDLVNKLFDVIAPVFKNKNGGYTRIIKLGLRKGDKAPLVKMLFSEEIPVEIAKPKKEEPKKNEEKEVVNKPKKENKKND